MPTPPTIPLYFSHSYRSEDRDLNEFFWELFWAKGFRFTVDPKSETLSVPYLELMMRRSAGFAAVVTRRPEQPRYLCSPFILFEYGLAVQAQKPLLTFVEEGIPGRYFPQKTGILPFSRERLAEEQESFDKAIELLAEKSRAYRNIDVQLRGKVGLLLRSTRESRRSYASVLPKLERILSDMGYSVEALSLDFEENFKLALDLDQLDFVVLDVGPSLPAWVYPFLHGRFIPSIKLFHMTGTGPVKIPSPLLTGQLLPGLASVDDPILFWREGEQLIELFRNQIKKFEGRRAQFFSLEQGQRYFRSLGRSSAKVFISNASDSNEFASRLSEELSFENVRHFQYKRQNTIELGSEWQKGLIQEIEGSEIFLPLASAGYARSLWCLKELETAERLRQQGRMTIIPYLLQDVREISFPTQGRALYTVTDESQKLATVLDDLDKVLQAEAQRERPAAAIGTGDIDVAIITILPEEYEAVLAFLGSSHQRAPATHEAPNAYGWELGEIRSPAYRAPYRVVVALSGRPGNNNGVLVTVDTVRRWKPRYVLLVGIAGGLGPDKIKVGDVVVSDVIWGYEYGKIEQEFRPRPNFTVQADHSLLTAAQALDAKTANWKDLLASRHRERKVTPTLKIGAIGSGDKVIDDLSNEFFRSVLQPWPKLMAVEMEGIGAATAVQRLQEAGETVGFAMIRGISDLPKDSQKAPASTTVRSQTEERDSWKQVAAEAAACFSVHLIQNGWPLPPRGEK